MKDGQGLKTDKQFQRQNSANAREKTRASEAPSQGKAPGASANVEIPDNVESLTVKQLKVLLDSLGVKRDDCFEKDDLIQRVKETKAGRGKPAGSR